MYMTSENRLHFKLEKSKKLSNIVRESVEWSRSETKETWVQKKLFKTKRGKYSFFSDSFVTWAFVRTVPFFCFILWQSRMNNVTQDSEKYAFLAFPVGLHMILGIRWATQ